MISNVIYMEISWGVGIVSYRPDVEMAKYFPLEYRRTGPSDWGEGLASYKLHTGPFVKICE